MRKATSRAAPPLRKSEPAPAIPDDYLTPRWGNADLRRVLALSTLGVVLFGVSWLTWRSTWLLWPAGICALALQMSATVIAARAAADSQGRSRPRRAAFATSPDLRRASAGGAPPQDDLLTAIARLVLDDEGEAEAVEPEAPPEAALLTIPLAPPPVHDHALHQAFFRRIVDAEFAEHPPGMVWPELGALQGSLATRLRLFRRYATTSPQVASDITEHERGPHTPWAHLAALDAAQYRRGDTVARLAHRAFVPLAFLELHARIDLEAAEREALESELVRLYSVGYGRVLTPPALLSAVAPLADRLGGARAINVADEARLAMRSASTLEDAERARAEWLVRARATRVLVGWSDEVMSLVECLIDYWLVQRAAAADVDWAEELARLDGGTIGAALAKRDASGGFQFAEAMRLVCGSSRRAELPLAQDVAPTAAITVA